MNSVERIKEYEGLVQEAEEINHDNRPPPEWPHRGHIEFQDYALAYKKVSVCVCE